MNRKWTVLSATLAAVVLTAAGFSTAADDEDSPIHKLMEKVGAKNGAINKAVRTPVAFKKAGGKAVAADALEIVKLYKEAREMKEPAAAQKKSYDLWTKYMDTAIKDTEDFAAVAEKDDHAAAKKSFDAVKKDCGTCHNDFRVDKD